VGGAAGAYASLLARRGYEVHLVDFVPLHVEQAQRAFDDLADSSFATATIADARRLPFRAHVFDAVLLLGPLYHLTERDDRIHTIGEALRILRGSGLIFAAAISRFASTYDGIARGFLSDENFRRIVEADVANGQHRNPTEHPDYFTTAYFHHPEELAEELVAAGSTLDGVFAIEGPASWLADYDYWADDPVRRDSLLTALRRVEREPSILGASAHILGIARRAARPTHQPPGMS
jgi:hypothetical protein